VLENAQTEDRMIHPDNERHMAQRMKRRRTIELALEISGHRDSA
jgi:hypothetical protein